METQYFDTLRVMEQVSYSHAKWNHILIILSSYQLKFERQELHHEISFLRKSQEKDMSTFYDESTWRMGNIENLSTILKDLESQLTEAEQYESHAPYLNEKSAANDKGKESKKRE
jgi:hypothetical protein